MGLGSGTNSQKNLGEQPILKKKLGRAPMLLVFVVFKNYIF
jgi:hypothetical protein